MSGRILIAHDGVTARIVLKARLSSLGYDIVLTANPDELVAQLSANVDAVMLSGQIGGHDISGTVERIRNHRAGDGLPVIILEPGISRDARIRLLSAGADAIMECDASDAVLQSRLRNLLRRSVEERNLARDLAQSEVMSFAEYPALNALSPGRIALVAATGPQSAQWRETLSVLMRDNIEIIAPETALSDIRRKPPPDAVLILQDPANPGAARQLLADIRCDRDTMRAVAIVLQPTPDTERTIRLYDLDATDVLFGAFDAEEAVLIIRRELRRKAVNDQKRMALRNGLNMAVRDPLTGLYNRRYALSQLGNIISSAESNGEEFAVMVLDLDRFKSINDTFGHAGGDEVLIEIARRLTAGLRNEDFVARIGGEEFVAVVRNCDPLAARAAAERLRRAVANDDIEFAGKSVRVTVSIGLVLSTAPGVELEPTAIIEQADRSLYVAKSAGRNQVTTFESAA